MRISLDNMRLEEDDFDFESSMISVVPTIEEDNSEFLVPEMLPLMPLRNTVLFPGVIIPITLGREKSQALIRDVQKTNGLFGALCQKDGAVENPQPNDLYDVGTVAQVIKVLQMPDNTTSVIIQGKRRFKVVEYLGDTPYYTANVVELKDILPTEDSSREFEALVNSLKDLALKVIKRSPNLPPEASFTIRNIDNPVFLINFISAHSDLKIPQKQDLLENSNVKSRGTYLMEILLKEVQLMDIMTDIQKKVKSEIDQQQREYLLNQQIKTIQDELGGNPHEQDIKEMREKMETKKWSSDIKQVFEKELTKLQRLNHQSGEFSVQFNYLQNFIELPWNEYSKDNFDLKNARKVLDKDHFGMEKVKERILEHLAVLKLKGDLKSPIICLHGAPGVGKTSLGKSIAESLGRKYVRMSLGGLHDEAEIRGHRKTYIGAMMGRILQNIKKAGTSNPVFILDEIDKMNASAHGDPASALLEVLDPEQNSAFHDNFLDVDFDLSNVMFIATANTLSTISQPLLDRMELIDVSGYLLEEKVEIAKRHLLPKQLSNHGISKEDVTLSKKVLTYLVEGYTRESGVRELDKIIAKLCRRLALKIADNQEVKKNISESDIRELLGIVKYTKDKWQDNDTAGVVTGLAWTAVGGEILFIESSLSKGKGKLTLTGNLGEVMKESAVLALEYLRAHAAEFGIRDEAFDEWNVHVHVPEGAIPKDGPSAGITMATALASSFTQRKVKKRIAMTGEITLRGKVLPVGGIKEKILAAKRAGIQEIILSEENRKDIDDINDIYIEGLTFHFVKQVREVLELALLKEKVDKALIV